MTTKSAAPMTGPGAVWAWARVQAEDALQADEDASAAYQRIADHRRAMHEAENDHAKAQERAKELREQPRLLARALAWLGVGIIPEVDDRYHTAYNGSDRAVSLRAAFGAGRALLSRNGNHAPRGNAYGWPLIGPHTSVTIWEAEQGSNDPDKQAAQRDAAETALLAWLADRTAEAWLTRQGFDPAGLPTLAEAATVVVDLAARHGDYPGERYYRPSWRLTIGGATVDELDDTRELVPFLPGEGGADQYQRSRAEIGATPTDEAEARAWAEALKERAGAVMVARLGPSGR